MFSAAALERHHAACVSALGLLRGLGPVWTSLHTGVSTPGFSQQPTSWSTFHALTLSGEQRETPESGGVERESDSPCDVPRADLSRPAVSVSA